jgi:hypothetical protein
MVSESLAKYTPVAEPLPVVGPGGTLTPKRECTMCLLSQEGVTAGFWRLERDFGRIIDLELEFCRLRFAVGGYRSLA